MEPGPSTDRRQARTWTASQRRATASTEQEPLGQAHPLGTGQRPRRAQVQPTRRAPRAAPLRVGPLPVWQLKEGLRDLYRLADPADAPDHLEWWLRWACRCRIPAFVTLAKTIRANRDRILAAIELGLSNSKLEGINSKIRLINHRGYGHHSAAALIAMVYLCCGGITVQLPTER